MSSVTGTPQGTVSFTYDFAGRRVSKTVGGVTTYYLYDGDLLIAELDSSGTVLMSYWWGALGLMHDANQFLMPRFYQFDPQGNTRGLFGKSGNLIAMCGWGPYGSYISRGTIEPPTPLKWRGQEGSFTDSETGFVYMLNRYYAPTLGRFISRDPIGFEGDINLYGYAAGDPVNYSDPSGLQPDDDFYEELGKSGSWGSFWARAGQKGFDDLQSMPQWQPGSRERVQTSGMINGIPYIGQIKMGLEAITGKDIVSGLCLTPGERLVYSGALVAGAIGPAASAAVPQRTYGVYRAVQQGTTRYVGITRNFKLREAWHRLVNGWQINRIPGLGGLSKMEARSVEQYLIWYFGGPNNGMRNRINSISPSNVHFNDYLRLGHDLLERAGFFN